MSCEVLAWLLKLSCWIGTLELWNFSRWWTCAVRQMASFVTKACQETKHSKYIEVVVLWRERSFLHADSWDSISRCSICIWGGSFPASQRENCNQGVYSFNLRFCLQAGLCVAQPAWASMVHTSNTMPRAPACVNTTSVSKDCKRIKIQLWLYYRIMMIKIGSRESRVKRVKTVQLRVIVVSYNVIIIVISY